MDCSERELPCKHNWKEKALLDDALSRSHPIRYLQHFLYSGAIVAPKLFDNLGRKFTMYAASWLFIVGAALQAGAVNMLMLQIPRLLSGSGIGMLSMCSPVYM